MEQAVKHDAHLNEPEFYGEKSFTWEKMSHIIE